VHAQLRKWRKNIMKKRILATIMTLTLGAAMLTACGSKADETVTNETAVVDTTIPTEETVAPSTEEAGTEIAPTEEAGTETAPTEEAGTETASTEEANTEAASTEEAGTETASTEEANTEATSTEEAGTETTSTETAAN